MSAVSLERRLERIEAHLKVPEKSGAFRLPRSIGQWILGLLGTVIVGGGSWAVEYAIDRLEGIETKQSKLRNAVIDNRVLMIDMLDHIPSVPETESLKKARKQVARAKRTREIFPEEDMDL